MAKSGPTIERVANGNEPQPPPPDKRRQAAAALPQAPVSLKQRRGWRPGLLLVGLFLVVGSMLGGLLLFDSLTTTTSVLVASGDLERGQVLELGDVRVADVSLAPDVNVLTLAEQRFLGGSSVGEPIRVLRGFVPEGTLLSEEHFIVQADAIKADEALLGLRLESGDYPSLMNVGDEVEMFVLSDRSSGEDAAYLGRAEVWRVWQSISEEDRTEDLVADLLIKVDVQSAAVQAHAEDLLRLTVVQGDQG